MNMDIVADLFPDIHETHTAFYDTCKTTLRNMLGSLIHEHLAPAGFVLESDVQELLHDISDVAKSLCSELVVTLYDPATGANLRVVAYVDSDIADEDTFALDTAMGLAVYRDVTGLPSALLSAPIASAGAVAYGAKAHQAAAQDAFSELAKLQVGKFSDTVQERLTP